MKNRSESEGNQDLLERWLDADCSGEAFRRAEADDEKKRTKQQYDDFNRRLNELTFGRYAFFLNYGYVPKDNPSFAVVSPPAGQFDVNSRRLVLEVIADCPLDERDVLDVSCGRGSVPMVLGDYFRPRSYLGIDISSEAVGFCRQYLRSGRFEFEEGDAESLPVAASAFDVVINIEASHRYPRIESFLGETHRVLRPDGWFLYADLMTPKAHDRNTALLRRMGFEMTRDADITSNVLLSCEETAERRMKVYRDPDERAFMADILAAPGSRTYQAFEQGLLSYRLFTFRKTAQAA
jgi:ubiquinone/menaquinone biosynthesis C-methylase UbiE